MEQGIRFAAFQPFCEAGAYDVMMPDVKYVGGLREMLQTADQFARHGVRFSPRNPTGPTCHAASLQLSAAAIASCRRVRAWVFNCGTRRCRCMRWPWLRCSSRHHDGLQGCCIFISIEWPLANLMEDAFCVL